MAARSTGRGKASKKPTTSEYTNGNGTLNGGMNGHMNGHIDKSKLAGPVTVAPPQRKPSRTFSSVLKSVLARIAVWYLILTIAFRCPSSITKISETSPGVCKPYLHARSYVTPYLDPYYQEYVAPQVEKVQPYWDSFENQVYTPVATFTKDKYAAHGAHRVEQGRHYLDAQWQKTAQPQLQKVQESVAGQYQTHLGPHVKKVSDVVMPIYEDAKDSMLEIYHLTLLPAYEAVLPYMQRAYVHGHYAVSHIVFPYVQSARQMIWAFTTRTVWPRVRVLYGDNVEPQLVRIRERLGRHRDQQKMESAVHAVESEAPVVAEKAAVISDTASTSATPTSDIKETTKSTASESPSGSGWDILNDIWPSEALSTATEKVKSKTATQPEQPKLTGAELREKLSNDLRQWQTKFAVAADKGSEDLEQRVAEITDRQIKSGVHGHGAAMLIQLEETADSTIKKFKKVIQQTVEGIPEDASESDLESAYEKCIAKTRELGFEVKEKAQAIRTWRASYDQETDDLVRAAVKSTVEVLERIHGLGLQEVGMRWAWTDGVTYKDWQKYHKLRNTLTEWQAEVEAVGSRHEGLKEAHDEAKKLEDKAMDIAQTMVGELVRLKNVSRWKIWADDATDDFSDKAVPARMHKASKSIASNVEEMASKASNSLVGSETPKSESIASAIKNQVHGASSQASSAASSLSSSGQSLASAAADKAGGIPSQVTSAAESATDSIGSMASSATSMASEAAAKVSEAAGEQAEHMASMASEVGQGAKEKADAVKNAAEVKVAPAASASKKPKVLGGAMAQVLAEAREIIFDDDDDESDTLPKKLQDMIYEAGDRASDLSRVVSEALLRPSKTQGSVESVTSLANEHYEAAIAAASRVLYGTEQKPIESMTSVASEKFAEAVTAASYAIYGTPTPTAIIRTVHVQASSKYDQAVSLANEQYANAKSQLSVLVSGTPKPAHETMLSLIEKAYSDSLAAASDRLQLALHYTDSIKSYASPTTQGYLESVSSIASSKLSEGLSAASAQFSAQFSAQPTPAMAGARRQYYEAVGLAHAKYQEFLDSASSAVYGPQQGTIESIASVASASAQSAASIANEKWESMTQGEQQGTIESIASVASASAQSAASRASENWESLTQGESQGTMESIASVVSDSAQSAASQASENWEALISKASSQVYGSQTPWAQSVYSQAGEYGAQATAQAVEQYAAVQALVSELVVGKEPVFTESVMHRLSSAYHVGLPAAISSASSYASANIDAATSLAGEGYDHVTAAAADVYESASSVVSSIFTPPPAIETVLSQASEQINQAVESASVAVYGTTKGSVEQATDNIASAYSSVQSQASEAIYGTQQAQNRFAEVAASAQAAISEAVFGAPTPSGFIASATDGAGSVISSVTSVVGEKAADAAASASSAIYGPEQGAVESASSRLAAALEAANSRISEMYASAASTAGDAASSASSVVSKATQGVKDEL
ncbi:hypothetical protein M011DRAFT_476735 [Sporormia fimetaria CBS 119925]|uniref:Transcription factor hoxa13 n=1 Tax=Sporormia fimetaria CBS 119925 TaxID=1340428 RepID=A0A6A6VFZ4_9PLEO|nr:hypothetical protein M011DRAFT_476735 [Sporormia fimetaria CBS 119925]